MRPIPLGIIALAAAALAAPPCRLAAQTPATPPTIDACYVPASGTIYRIDTPASPAAGAPKQCLTPAHVRFTWNQQGPKGDKGDKGDTGAPGPAATLGYERRSSRGNLNADEYAGFRMTCPQGKRAVGGGINLLSSALSVPQIRRIHLRESYPSTDREWRVGVDNQNGFPAQIDVYVVCL